MNDMTIEHRAKNIKLLVLDVDGILTDGRLYYSNQGDAFKAFDVKDGLGMNLLMRQGIQIAIITGREADIVTTRMQDLNIRHVFQGQKHKLPTFLKLCETLDLSPQQAAYMGDDLQDLAILRHTGFSATVPSASALVKQHVHYITQKEAGQGAVREVCELILQAKGQWQRICQDFLDDGVASFSERGND